MFRARRLASPFLLSAMFVDEVKVYSRAGHGGRGCISFLREAYRPKGGPDGGNGGRGGDVILEADHDLNNLIQQFYQPRLLAKDGEHGLGKGMDGHAGRDLVIKVPCGTLVWRVTTPPASLPAPTPTEQPPAPDKGDPEVDAPGNGSALRVRTVLPCSWPATGIGRPLRHAGEIRAMEIDVAQEPEEVVEPAASERELVVDLTTHGQRFVLCKGDGAGSATGILRPTAARQSPRFAQPGEPGEEGDYLLELRILAEVGLVGYPNAGKSTLLTAISKARPKVAPYPFTTLTPQIGIVEYHDFRRVVVCDVPGLIEGAHRNVGLGHAFLRHIQRCKVVVVSTWPVRTAGRLGTITARSSTNSASTIRRCWRSPGWWWRTRWTRRWPNRTSDASSAGFRGRRYFRWRPGSTRASSPSSARFARPWTKWTATPRSRPRRLERGRNPPRLKRSGVGASVR